MEDKCLKCGKCCHQPYLRGGEVIRKEVICVNLTKDNLCNVYNERPKWCLSSEDMKSLGILPNGCGYNK